MYQTQKIIAFLCILLTFTGFDINAQIGKKLKEKLQQLAESTSGGITSNMKILFTNYPTKTLEEAQNNHKTVFSTEEEIYATVQFGKPLKEVNQYDAVHLDVLVNGKNVIDMVEGREQLYAIRKVSESDKQKDFLQFALVPNMEHHTLDGEDKT